MQSWCVSMYTVHCTVIVPVFTISVFSSSCNYLFFSFIFVPFAFAFTCLAISKAGWEPEQKRENCMNCRTQKLLKSGIITFTSEASLIVPDFSISLSGSSCVHLLFCLIFAPLLSLSISLSFYFPKAGWDAKNK